jgi:predicted dinucleotide-utilizing enzyme
VLLTPPRPTSNQAYRLLGSARAELGDKAAAAKAAEAAAAEAVLAKDSWMEMLALRDRLKWCAPVEREAVLRRLMVVVEAAKQTASREEVEEALGGAVMNVIETRARARQRAHQRM